MNHQIKEYTDKSCYKKIAWLVGSEIKQKIQNIQNVLLFLMYIFCLYFHIISYLSVDCLKKTLKIYNLFYQKKKPKMWQTSEFEYLKEKRGWRIYKDDMEWWYISIGNKFIRSWSRNSMHIKTYTVGLWLLLIFTDEILIKGVSSRHKTLYLGGPRGNVLFPGSELSKFTSNINYYSLVLFNLRITSYDVNISWI